jgi:hypothetical protein
MEDREATIAWNIYFKLRSKLKGGSSIFNNL